MKELLIEEYIFRTVVLMEDGKPIYIRVSELPEDLNAGDIVYGIVKNVSNSTGNAFIDIGRKKQAIMTGIKKDSFPSVGEGLILEVLREEDGKKGARVTDDISLARQEMVVRKGNGICLSGNLKDTIPEELKRHLPGYTGVNMLYRSDIVNHPIEEILETSEKLKNDFLQILGYKNKIMSPSVVYKRESGLMDLIRENEEDLIKVITNGEETFSEIKEKFPSLPVSLIPGSTVDVKNLRNFIDRLRRKTVPLPSGGNIVIEETESLTAVDVNSSSQGKRGGKSARVTNLEALEELKNQMELRNLSGAFIVDFVEMNEERLKEELYYRAKELFRSSRPRVTVYPLTELSLMQLTRRREGKPLSKTIFKRETDKKLEVNPQYLYEILFIRFKSLREELKEDPYGNAGVDKDKMNIPLKLSISAVYKSSTMDSYLETLKKEFSEFSVDIQYSTDCDLYRLERQFITIQ